MANEGKNVMKVKGSDKRNLFHFEIQRTTRMGIVQSRKHRKPKHKKDYLRDEQ